MTKTLSVNQDNDLFINNIGNLSVSEDVTALEQACEQAIKALRGEMLYSANRGMPHFEVTFTGSPNVVQFEAAAKKEIKAIPGVTGVVSFSAQVVNNTMAYTATITTIHGTGAISG